MTTETPRLLTEQEARITLEALQASLGRKIADREAAQEQINGLRAEIAQQKRIVNAFKPRKRGSGKLVAEGKVE